MGDVMNKCEDCAESMGMLDDANLWCVELGGIVNKLHVCDKFRKGGKDEPVAVDPWHSADID